MTCIQTLVILCSIAQKERCQCQEKSGFQEAFDPRRLWKEPWIQAMEDPVSQLQCCGLQRSLCRTSPSDAPQSQPNAWLGYVPPGQVPLRIEAQG